MKMYLQELEKIFLSKGLYADRDYSASDFKFETDNMDSAQEILSIVERFQSNYKDYSKLLFDRYDTANAIYLEYEIIDNNTAEMILVDIIVRR